ncbi:MAG TPA: TetR family transcriptional regulator [Actinomycetes bacterium]|nr:TetR family transcriptional regulator [Actinomycetes bacterium]
MTGTGTAWSPAREAGRRERGLRRRRAILEATLGIIGEQGTAAVTHRAVAAAAGVPLAATTYYFASKDDLLDQTLRFAAEEELAALERDVLPATDAATFSDAVDRLCAVVWHSYRTRGRVRALALYEIYLEAARRPALRAVAQEWNEACVRLLVPGLRGLGIAEPEAAARMVLAMLDGFMIEDLGSHQPGFEQQILRPSVERLLRALGGAPG